jgi:hypothetical protein
VTADLLGKTLQVFDLARRDGDFHPSLGEQARKRSA